MSDQADPAPAVVDETPPGSPRKPRLRRWLAIVTAFAAAACFMIWLAGEQLTAPQRHPVGDPPPDLHAKNIEFVNARGGTIRGWICEPQAPIRGAVLLLHGVRADRRSMAARAGFLASAGYAALLFDFQAHGESDGTQITFGLRESEDVLAAVDFLHRELPGQPLAAIGSSLGGAACLLGAERPKLSALVLEAVYPDIRDAARNRMRIVLGTPGTWLTPLLLMQVPGRLGAGFDRLRPIDGIAQCGCPVLVIGGMEDKRTPPDETQELFGAAREPKTLWMIPKAAHVDFHHFARAEYERKVLAFLDNALSPTKTAAISEPLP